MRQFRQRQSDIRNCDCLEYLATVDDGVVDLVLIDPPYEVSRDTNFKSGEAKGIDTDRFRVSMNFGDWDYGFNKLGMVIKEAYRILRKAGTLICFYDLWKISTLKKYFTEANFKQLRFIEWLKTNPDTLSHARWFRK
ncbi:MAG: site-specific DNA-methyltransferase [Alphaproteobacteria bacterium]|nr:site-specific DNA-methyltransferase [Alphaproteobacteria bacterium]